MFRRYNGRHVMIRAVRALSVQARIGIAASTLAGLSVVGLMFANTASASTRLGGVDMQRACSVQQATFGPTTAVVRDKHNAYSWACRSNYFGDIVGGVKVNQECVLQYGPDAYAGLGSASNPYSWYCQRDPVPTLTTSSTPPPTSSTKTYAYSVYHTCANGKCGLNLRSGAGYSNYPVTRTLVDGNAVDIVCQTRGQSVSGIDGSSSNVWDKTAQGDYAADFYIDTPGMTGSFSPPIPQC